MTPPAPVAGRSLVVEVYDERFMVCTPDHQPSLKEYLPRTVLERIRFVKRSA